MAGTRMKLILGKEGIIPMERFGCKWLKRKKEPGSN